MDWVPFQADASRAALWVGGTEHDELRMSLEWLQNTLARWKTPLAVCVEFDDLIFRATHDPTTPRLAILATDRPARWTLEDALRLSCAWPLLPIVSVASSLVDGRRRSGPPLPGIEEIPWCDLPGRVETWLVAWENGRVGTLAVPNASRRDERLLGIHPATALEPPSVAVVAPTPLEADGLAAMVPVAGGVVSATQCGRPRLDETASVLVWDVGAISADTLGWLSILAANCPQLAIIIVESFPRCDSVRAALEAGAGAVLGKPVAVEALMGTLRRLTSAADGLGERRPDG